MTSIFLVFHLILAVAIIVLVLLQQGKGSDMGSAFGGGSSQSLFGARGSANFLSRMTSTLVTTFFITSLVLAFMYTQQGQEHGVVDDSVIGQVEQTEAARDESPPAAPEAEGEAPPSDVPLAPEQ